MTMPNQCQFWDCGEIIRSDHFLCYDHWIEYQDDDIDECPQCDSYKSEEYDVCLNCYRQGPSAGQRPAAATIVVERDDREFAGDQDTDRFFVYILLLNDGNYYVGQTNDLLARLHEHRNGMSQSTRGKEPKLQWFMTVPTRDAALNLEAALQILNEHPADRRQITNLVIDFRKLTAELDYTPHRPTAQPTERPPFGGVTPPSSRGGRRQIGNPYQGYAADVDDLPF